MKKMLHRENGWIFYIFSFLLPLLLLMAVFAALDITPFGSDTLLYSDADGQYINYFSYAARVLHGQESILYSFSKDLGGQMLNQIGGYLFNPFYLLFFFGTYETFPTIYSLVCILTTALAGLTMFAFLSHNVSKHYSMLIFSTAYALCGYSVANNFQLFWLLSVAMLPLIAWGIHRILEGRSAALYFAALTFTIFQSSYIGYMLCVFSLLYFSIQFFLTAEQRNRMLPAFSGKNVVIRYATASLFSGLLNAVLLIPVYWSYREGRLTQVDSYDFQFVENMPLLQMGAKLFSGASSALELINGRPHIFCTLFVVALALLFFLDGRNEKREKYGYAILLGVYLLSFYLKTFSTIFQMFSEPNWFNFRYSFVFSFLLILIAAREFIGLESVSPVNLKKCLTILAIATVLIFAQSYEFVSGGMAVLDWLILLIIFGGYLFYQKHPERADRKAFVLLALLCTSMSLYVNYYYSVHSLSDWEKTMEEYQDGVRVSGALVEAVQSADSGFYRMETEKTRYETCGNDGVMFGYNGVGQFTSTERAYILKGLSRFGVSWFDMRSFYDPGMPAAMESFLGLKYIIGVNDLQAEKGYEKKATVEDQMLYLNRNALGIAILSDDSLSDIDIEAENIYALQNRIWKGMTSGTQDIYTPVTGITYTIHSIAETKEYTADGDNLDVPWAESEETSETDAAAEEAGLSYYLTYSFVAENENPVYLYLGSFLTELQGTSFDTLRYIGTYQAGETVTGTIELSGTLSELGLQQLCDCFSVYYENLDVLREYSAILQSRQVTIQKEKGNIVSGTVNCDTPQTLLLTIPYDAGWTLYVDGEETPYEKTLGIFMRCELEAGEHTWKMVYVPEGMKLGGIISAATAVAAVLFFVWEGKRKKRRLLCASEIDGESPEPETVPPATGE